MSRYKNLDPSEQRIASLRRDGYLPVDVFGRPRVPLGNGPESQLARATHPIQEPRLRTVSRGLTAKDFKLLYTSTAVANLSGWVLNTFATVAWRVDENCSETFAAQCHNDLLERMRAWFRDRRKSHPNLPYAAIWVKEVGRKLGLHSHFLLHVPYELRFDFRRWLERAAHKLIEAPDINPFKEDGTRRLVHVSPNFDADVAEQWNVFRYLVKGLEPSALLTLRHEEKHIKHLVREFAGIAISDQGRVMGKRCGNTHDVGPAALTALKQRFGTPVIWPEHSLQGDELGFDDRFIRAGHIGRHLGSLPEI
ncbi:MULTISPECIES: hypothetical protein [Sphingomonas]|uniref:hypothetical protein n=1 Tax=Sphingomonas TaxID=13687 RepID=UPI00126997B5|nr:MULTISPECIES: hypothetical protein [Sphingomonas]